MSYSDNWEPIYERFQSSDELLSQVAIYYPDQYNALNLDQAQFLGRGAEAYVFHIGDKVYKFTMSREDAQVSWELTKRPQDHLVNVDDVVHLPNVGVWMIVEERLNKMDDWMKKRVDSYFEGTDLSAAELRIWSVIQDLEDLGVSQWNDDCVSSHNLMVCPNTGLLKAMDFGFTKSSFVEDYAVWT